MIEIPATEFAKNFGRYKELAQRETVAITSHGRTSGYFVSEHEYAEYTRLKARAVKVYDIAELPDDLLTSLKTVKMDSRHDHLNDLLGKG